MVFNSQYWSCAARDLSPPPNPERPNPPNGVLTSPSPYQLTETVPARIWRAALWAVLFEALKTEAVKP